MKHERALAYAAFATICVVWGTTYLAIRIAIETIPPLLMTSIRFTIAGVVILAISHFRGERIPREPRTLVNLVVIGFLMVGMGNLAVVWAEKWVPSGLAALFVATAPFWMALMEALRRGGERLEARGVVGMLIGFVGVAMLVTPDGSGGALTTGFIAGAIAIQIGSIAWQLGSLRGKYYVTKTPLMTSAGLQMLSGGTIVGIIAIAIGEPARFALNGRTLGALVYLTIFGSIIAYSAYVYALAHLPTTKMSLYAYINPVVAVVLGWLILDEALTWVSVLAMCVILSGVALVQMPRFRTAPSRIVSAES